MTTREAALAWRLFEANWIPIGAMCAVVALVLMTTDFSFTLGGTAFSFGFVAVYGGFAYYNAHAPHRRDPQIVFALGSTAQIVLITVVMTPMTYFAAALNFPLQDALLDHVDRAMGLDWRAYLAFVNDHEVVRTGLTIGYGMIRWPIFIIPVALVIVRDYRRLQEFTLAFALALIATTIVSALVPAIGTFYHLHLTAADYPNIEPLAYLEQLRDLPPVRDGSLRHLNLLTLTGLVTFPSFHAASAVLYLWALWPVRWLRAVALVSNATMLVATPIHGGHYFVDVIAGVAVAVAGIVAARAVSRRVETLQSWAGGFTLRPWPWRPRQEKPIQSTS